MSEHKYKQTVCREYSQGVCHDGAAILKDGAPMTIEEILEDLRSGHSASNQVSCEGLIHLTREHWQALSLLEYAVRQGRGHDSITKALERLSEIHNLVGGDAGTDTDDGTMQAARTQSQDHIPDATKMVGEAVGFIPDGGLNNLKAGHPARIYPAGSTPSPFERSTLIYTHPPKAQGVPEVATEEMLDEGVQSLVRGLKKFPDNYTQIVSNIWEDMLSTTPPAAKDMGGER